MDRLRAELREENAAQALKNSVDRCCTQQNLGDITKEAMAAAKSLCQVCQGRFERKFNQSQLLVEGHSIDLHAESYNIRFEKKKRKNGDMARVTNEIVGLIECKCDDNLHAPSWSRGERVT